MPKFKLNSSVGSFLLIVISSLNLYAQQPSLESIKRDTISNRTKSWKKEGIMSLNFSQVSLSNWAAGGQNTFSGLALFKYKANYLDAKNSWDNLIDLGYGMTQNGDEKPVKSDDRIDVSSKYGRYAFNHWYYSVLAGFKSQFSKGYNYPNDSVAISNFLAPAYVTSAFGMDYKPSASFSLLAAPATMRLVIVNDRLLADAGSYGVEPAVYDSSGVKVKNGKTIKLEAGAMLRAVFQKDVAENINLSSKLELFSNYKDNPKNVDVNWEVLLNMKVNKYISTTISTNLIYDDNTDIAVDSNKDGIIDSYGPRTQFKEVLGVGLTYRF